MVNLGLQKNVGPQGNSRKKQGQLGAVFFTPQEIKEAYGIGGQQGNKSHRRPGEQAEVMPVLGNHQKQGHACQQDG